MQARAVRLAAWVIQRTQGDPRIGDHTFGCRAAGRCRRPTVLNPPRRFSRAIGLAMEAKQDSATAWRDVVDLCHALLNSNEFLYVE